MTIITIYIITIKFKKQTNKQTKTAMWTNNQNIWVKTGKKEEKTTTTTTQQK